MCGCGRDCATRVKQAAPRQIRARNNALRPQLRDPKKRANVAEIIPLIVSNPTAHLAWARIRRIREYSPIRCLAGSDVSPTQRCKHRASTVILEIRQNINILSGKDPSRQQRRTHTIASLTQLRGKVLRSGGFRALVTAISRENSAPGFERLALVHPGRPASACAVETHWRSRCAGPEGETQEIRTFADDTA